MCVGGCVCVCVCVSSVHRQVMFVDIQECVYGNKKVNKFGDAHAHNFTHITSLHV